MSDSFDTYPQWAQQLAHGMRGRLANTFILHGNVNDLAPAPASVDTRADFVPLTDFLAALGVRHARRHHRIPARQRPDLPHARFAQALHRRHLGRRRGARHAVRGVAAARADRVPAAARFVPAAASRSAASRSASPSSFRTRRRWSPRAPEKPAPRTAPSACSSRSGPPIRRSSSANVTLVLLTENLADISSRIVRSPQTIEIEVARPDEAERCAFLQSVRDDAWFAQNSDLTAARLAQMTSGLTRVQLRQILSSVDERRTRLDASLLRAQKKALIEAECFGLLEYVESKFTLDMVSGHEGVKERLRRAAAAIAAGRLRGVPMGYLIGGPVGSAKTLPGQLLHRRAGISVREVPELPLAVAGRDGRQSREDPEAAAIDVAGRRDHRRSGRLPRRPQSAGRLGNVEPRVRADLVVHGQHRVSRQDPLVPHHLPAGPAAGGPQAPGPGRRALRALLSGDPTRSTTRCSGSC